MYKQKTAYEVRISDWNSEVCSSDLERLAVIGETIGGGEIAEQPTRVAIEDRGFGEIGVHRGRTDADQHRIIMRIEAFGGADVDAGVRAQPLADEVRKIGRASCRERVCQYV